jgi:hypothetical protein
MMEKIKISVNSDNMIVLHCPFCEMVKQVSVAKFKDEKHTLKIRCSCQKMLTVDLDFRQKYRKLTNLRGEYFNLTHEQKNNRGHESLQVHQCQIVNISLTGLGLLVFSGHGIRQGDRLRVRFNLDDKRKSEIDRKLIVRGVRGNSIGCEFIDDSYQKYDKILGFYLLP